jgi:sodium/potassium-transporting ATPase subunit alpha
MQFYDAFSQTVPATAMPDGSIGMGVTQAAEAGFKKFDPAVAHLDELVNICYLCSKAKFDRTDVPVKQRTIIADATEMGLFSFATTTLADCDSVHDFI